MTNSRNKAIIAVFGGRDLGAVQFAQPLGAAIARREQILLTGGKQCGHTSVKESAICGAGSSPWIGVDRQKDTPVTGSENGVGFVIASDLDHKRNYLEAALCDSAIGLAGEEGTYSEVVFALSLHCPVALVGSSWKKKWPVNTDETLDSAATAAMNRVGKVADDRPKLQKLLNHEAILRGLQSLQPNYFRYFGSDGEAKPEEVVEWILTQLKQSSSVGLTGSLPSIEGYEDFRESYERWLAKYAV